MHRRSERRCGRNTLREASLTGRLPTSSPCVHVTWWRAHRACASAVQGVGAQSFPSWQGYETICSEWLQKGLDEHRASLTASLRQTVSWPGDRGMATVLPRCGAQARRLATVALRQIASASRVGTVAARAAMHHSPFPLGCNAQQPFWGKHTRWG